MTPCSSAHEFFLGCWPFFRIPCLFVLYHVPSLVVVLVILVVLVLVPSLSLCRRLPSLLRVSPSLSLPLSLLLGFSFCVSRVLERTKEGTNEGTIITAQARIDCEQVINEPIKLSSNETERNETIQQELNQAIDRKSRE